MIKKSLIDKESYFFLIIAVLILWRLLLPGYVLTLDMIFTPEMKVISSTLGYDNFLPFSYLIYFLNFVMPAWMIQKIILLILFFCLGYLPYKLLPLPENKTVRLFSALLYTVNPFVYSRFLAGHWTHLMAYALLPVFFYLLFKFTKNPSFRTSLKLFVTILFISFFSLHFFTMVVIITFIWILAQTIKYYVTKKFIHLKFILQNLLCSGLLFIIFGSYWLIPAILNGYLFKSIFDIKHWQAFATSGYNEIGTTLNVLSLNGYWGEGQSWATQFFWPQDYLIFWIAMVVIWLLISIGIIYGFTNKKFRSTVVFFIILGVVSFIFSAGVGETIFKNFNLFFYEHFPFWRGFRDSQKFSGMLVFSYVVLSGIGLNIIIGWLSKRKLGLVNYFNLAILLVPILFGFLLWGGFRNQMQVVWYPEVWSQANTIIQADNPDYKILFLPWHGYLSLNFNNNLLTANPARRFFGEQAIVSKSMEIKGIYDQELSLSYINLDRAINNDLNLSISETIDFFIAQNIKYIVYFQDLKEVDNLQYEFLSSDKLKVLINDKQLKMYNIVED